MCLSIYSKIIPIKINFFVLMLLSQLSKFITKVEYTRSISKQNTQVQEKSKYIKYKYAIAQNILYCILSFIGSNFTK